MESLKSVERNGEVFYCFIEVCAELLPQVSKSTVRNWLKLLHIPCVTCTPTERPIFRESNAYLCGSFGLISAPDVLRLLHYKDERKSKSPSKSSDHTAKSQCPATTSQESWVPVTSTPSTAASGLVEYSSDSDSDSEDCRFGLISTSMPLTRETLMLMPTRETVIPTPESVMPTRETVIPIPDYHLATPADEHIPMPVNDDESDDDAQTPVNPARRKSRYKLPTEEITPVLKEEISALRKFYLSPINPQRDNAGFSLSTLDKMIERLLTFMFYVKNMKKRSDLCLNICNEEEVVTDFVVYLKEVRELAASTITSILTVFINIVKYNFRHDSSKSINAPQLIAYRRMQRQLSKESRILSKRAKEGLTAKSSQKFYFSLILETLRNLKAKYFESRGIEKARYLHDFVLISLYLRAMPGRSNDIRLLKLLIGSETNPLDFSTLTSGNFIIFSEDTRVYLIQNDHKTVKSHGPSKLDISDDVELIRFLRMYLECRTRLMFAKSHDSFFLNCHGEPFASSSAVSNYLGNLFEREVSIRVGTNKLRHAIVTYFQSIDQSKDVSIRESLAALMKHSVRYQIQVYDDTTQDEKTKKGRDLLRQTVMAGLGEEVENDDDRSDESSLSEGDEFEIRPRINDICALLDPASTAEDIEFFLAKIVRYSPDGREVYLVHLKLVGDSDDLYKLTPCKVWKESTSSLIYPIDVIYNTSENAYQLRTSAECIYRSVHSA